MRPGAPRSTARARGTRPKPASRPKPTSRVKPASGAKTASGVKPASRAKAAPPIITPAELRRAVLELASTLAPADIGDLLAEEATLRARAADLGGAPGVLLRAQLELALDCVRDHAAGRCPQIPYFTISYLAAGLAYLADELDVIPDFLPHIGMLDDALVMAMACRLAEDGLRRYCTWKGIDAGPTLGVLVRRKERA